MPFDFKGDLQEPARCGIAIMGKASIPGRAKTRLSPPLSFQESAAFNTAFLKDIVDNVRLAGQRSSIDVHVAYGPPGFETFFRQHLPAEVGLFETWLPNFGDCLYRAIKTQFAAGHEAACVLNSDSPTLPTALLVQAAQALAAPGNRAVLGPCVDGGYYFLGMKRAHRNLFDDIDWSTGRVADQTRERAREIGLELIELDTWYDIDDADALRSLAGELLYGKPFRQTGPAAHAAPHTTALLRNMLRETDLADRLDLHVSSPPRLSLAS